MLKTDWKNSFFWDRVILNLRTKQISSKRLQALTGISPAKIRNMTANRAYTVNESEAKKLMDLHIEKCPEWHNKTLVRP